MDWFDSLIVLLDLIDWTDWIVWFMCWLGCVWLMGWMWLFRLLECVSYWCVCDDYDGEDDHHDCFWCWLTIVCMFDWYIDWTVWFAMLWFDLLTDWFDMVCFDWLVGRLIDWLMIGWLVGINMTSIMTDKWWLILDEIWEVKNDHWFIGCFIRLTDWMNELWPNFNNKIIMTDDWLQMIEDWWMLTDLIWCDLNWLDDEIDWLIGTWIYVLIAW